MYRNSQNPLINISSDPKVPRVRPITLIAFPKIPKKTFRRCFALRRVLPRAKSFV